MNRRTIILYGKTPELCVREATGFLLFAEQRYLK